MEDLASSTGLLLDKHELLRGVSTDQHPRVDLANVETLLCTCWSECVGMQERLLIFLNGSHIVEGGGTQSRGLEMVHVFERSQDNDHEEGVVNEPVLCKHLNILLKLANDSLGLALSDLELLEAL